MGETRFLILKGGSGSGNFGHHGRQGQRGGSSKRWEPDDHVNVVVAHPAPDAPHFQVQRLVENYVRGLRQSIDDGMPLHNPATGWDLSISHADQSKLSRDYKSTLISLRSVFSLRDLVTAAVLGESHNDQKQRAETWKIHRLYAPLLLDGLLLRVKLTVVDRSQGRRNMHALEALEIENPAVEPLIQGAETPSKSRPAGSSVSIRRLFDGVKRNDGAPMLKASAIPDGARWITVHSHSDGKGTPVLIQETKHGSGVYHVIGGAGGKLNYLKLRGVKSKEHYAQEVREKQGAKREEKKSQIQREKENGTHESQQAARKEVSEKTRAAERNFIQAVSSSMGWTPEEIAPPDVSGLSESAAAAVLRKHHNDLLHRAGEAADNQAKAAAATANAELESKLNEPEEAVPPDAPGLGYQPKFTSRTADQAGDIKAEASAVDDARRTPEQKEQLGTARARAADIKAALESAKSDLPDIKGRLGDAEQAMNVLRARQKLRDVRKAAAKARKAIDRGEQKAYVLEVSAPEKVDAAIMQQAENDARTMQTRAFLSAAGKAAGDAADLGSHVSLGAYNALNGVALGAIGRSGLDRDAVDVLGVSGAAQALAQRMRADLAPDDFDKATEALQAYHIDHYQQRAADALASVKTIEAKLADLKLPDAQDGTDLMLSRDANQKRKALLADGQKLLGQALGEMEAHAALLVALRDKSSDGAKVPLGKLGTEDAIRRLRAIGLQRGDYSIERAGPESIASITADGLKRIVAPADPEAQRDIRESLDIIEGRQDDPNFWPEGVAKRPDMALPDAPPAVTAALAQPFQAGPDITQSVRDYVGGRMADGHAIQDIVADLQTDEMARQVGDQRGAYFKALNEVVPLADADGKPIEAESRRAAFEKHAEDFVKRVHGGKFSPIHAQRFDVDDKSADALHRAFMAEPAGPLAFRAIGDLDSKAQGALRDYFDRNIASQDPEMERMRGELSAHTAMEPEKEVDDMFGRGTNPAHTAWKSRGDAIRADMSERGLDWGKYNAIMGGPAAAYAAVQDHLKGAVVGKFQELHSRLTGKPLKLGTAPISGHLAHLEAVDPAARDKRLAAQREMADSLRERTAGRYAAGGVAEKMDAAREAQTAMQQSQIGMFGAEPVDAKKPRALEKNERHTIGVAAESQLAQMSEQIGQNFKPGEPLQLGTPSMTGKFAPQQRAIKLIERNKRLSLAQGVGTGKTNMGLNSFAHLQTKGKAKRGLFIVPSIVQGQFGAEALRVLQPGKFKWHAAPGASREERLKHYADPKTHFNVVTHAAFRDDMLHLGAKAAGITETEMTEKVNAMPDAERNAWMKATMAGHGMDHDYMMVDEGHDLLNRRGKANSSLANVVDSASNNMKYYINASADPIKNDVSEAFDLLRKVAPEKYRDRDSFMRRYGVDTAASRDQLRREMARHFYPGRIDPGVKVNASETKVPLSASQKSALSALDGSFAKLRMAKLSGKVDAQSARAISPESFSNVPEEKHEEIAKRIQDSAGIVRETAISRIIDSHPDGGKIQAVADHANARRGKPGIVFAHSRAAVAQIAERLKAEGHRVDTITGSDSAAEKSRKRLKFKPDAGEASTDILVCSDAGAVGMNAQRGQWLLQHDTPLTAKTHAQRNGRIHRLGQMNPEIELTDLVGDHPHEREARRRLKTKYGLRDILTSPLEGLDDTGYAAYLNAAHRSERKNAA